MKHITLNLDKYEQVARVLNIIDEKSVRALGYAVQINLLQRRKEYEAEKKRRENEYKRYTRNNS